MKKFKSIAKAILLSHWFWAVISFGLVLLFTGLTQYDYNWNWKTTMLVISCGLFIMFGLGTVGLSLINLIINIVRKIKNRKKKK